MAKATPRIYWDSAAWIAYIRKEMPAADNKIKEPRYTMCRTVLDRAFAGEVEIVTSAFTLAEVCKRRSEAHDPGVNLPAFFDHPFILLVPVDKQIGIKAQNLQLANVGNVKPPDAIHLASAIVANVPVFHTFDGPLRELDKVLTLNNGNQLQIVRPTEETPLPALLAEMKREDD